MTGGRGARAAPQSGRRRARAAPQSGRRRVRAAPQSGRRRARAAPQSGRYSLLGAAAGGSAGLGLPALAGLLTAMEAGVPIPVPSDLVLLVLGERTSAGTFSLPVVIVALELVVAIGTTVLFFAIRGPGQVVLNRLGPRLGLTPARLARATRLIERRGRGALVFGRATPGLRTVTVAAAAGSRLSAGRALPPLIIGSSVFVQLHLALGYAFGPAVRDSIEAAKGPAIAAVAVVFVVGIVVWLRRRGPHAGAEAAAEASCPACLVLGALAPKAFALHDLEGPSER